MSTKIDKKGSYILIISTILLISLSLNVYQALKNSNYKIEIGKDVYESVEEIRDRNESILITLDNCLTLKTIDKEEILTLYKNFSLINISELNLWEHYLNNDNIKKNNKEVDINEAEKNPNEIFSKIEEYVYLTLLNLMDDDSKVINIENEVYKDFLVIQEISKKLNDYFIELNDNELKDLEGEARVKKLVVDECWIDVLKAIDTINDEYKDFIFKL